MKKILTSLLLISTFCLFFSCSPNSKTTNAIAKEMGYYSPFNTYWGMSKEECLKALNLKESKVTQGDKTENTSSFQVDLNFLNEKATGYFVFTDKDYSDGKNLGLTSICIYFKDTFQLNNILPRIQDDLKSKGLSYSNPEYNVVNIDLYNTVLTNSLLNASSKQDTSSTKYGYELKPSGVNSIDMIACQTNELQVEQGDNPNLRAVVLRGKGAALLYHTKK